MHEFSGELFSGAFENYMQENSISPEKCFTYTPYEGSEVYSSKLAAVAELHY